MERVKKAAELHGYKPKASLNRFFKALRGEVSGVVFLVDNAVQERLSERDPFYSQILWSVERALQKTGTHMILSNAHSNLTSSGSLYAIEEGMAHGVIIESHDAAMIAKLAQHTSVVVLNSDPRALSVDSVIPDIERAARSQMDCLVARGRSPFFYPHQRKPRSATRERGLPSAVLPDDLREPQPVSDPFQRVHIQCGLDNGPS